MNDATDIREIVDEIVAELRAGHTPCEQPVAKIPMYDPACLSEMALMRIDALVTRDDLVMEAVETEPQVMHLLKLAVIPGEESRWRRYELLKHLGTSLVGWEARAEALRTSQHYEHFVRAIDTLLPGEEVEA